jgi:hypothetical protein
MANLLAPLPGALPKQQKGAGPPLVGKLGAPGAKAAPIPKPTKVISKPLVKGSTAKVAGPPLTGGIPRTFAGAPPLAKAYKNAPAEAAKPAPKKGGDGILGTLGQDIIGGTARGAVGPVMASILPQNNASVAKSLETAASNAPGNAVHTVTGIIPGAIATGKAGVEAVKGKPQALEQIGKGLVNTAEHPLKSFEKEPVSTGLMALGAEAGVGEAAGGLARSGALGDATEAAASTARPDLKLFNDESIPREYSKDVIRKGAQVAADKFREKILNDPDVNQATGTRLNRHIYGGGVLSQHLDRAIGTNLQGLIKPGVVDKAQGSFTDIRKMYSNAANKTMHDIKEPLPKGAEEAVPLAVEGTIRRADTARADLEGRLASLKAAAEGLTGREVKLNRAQQDQITTLLANKRFMTDPQPVIDAAKDFSDHQQPLVDRKVQVGALEPDQVHAKYVPYATQHMGAEYNLDPGKHPLVSEITGLNRAAEKARQDVKTAQARVAANREVGNSIASHERDLSTKRADHEDAQGRVLKAKETLGYLKDNGAIKNNGDMYPRLELNGNPLTTDEIQAHARQELGDRDIGFLSHKEGSWGQAVHAKSGVRPAIESRSRTGIAYKTGTYDSSFDALKRQAYKDAQDVAGHDSRDDMIRRFGFGSYKDPELAQRAADNFNHTPDGERLTKGLGEVQVVHAGPDRVMNRANMPSSVATDSMKDFGVAEHKAISELGPEGKYRLMPKSVVDRIQQHDALNSRGGVAKTMQALTNKFRNTALYTNPHWPVGIAQENMIRLGFAGVNPFAAFKVGSAVKLGDDLADHFRTISADPATTEAQRFAAKAQVAAIDSGTQYGGLMNNAVHRSISSQLPEGFQTFTDSLSEKAPASQVLRAWNGWKQTLGNSLHKMGTNTKKAMVGKVALREQQKFSQEWQGLITRQDHAVKAYAVGKLTPSASAKLGDDVLRMAGNWSQLTPFVRSMTQTAAPFALWYLNSMKFVFKTLPVDHPFKTAALAAMAAATGSTQNAHPTAEYLDGGVGVKLPIVGNITAEVSKYSPFGIGVEPKETALGIFGMPTIADPLQQAVGLNPLDQEPYTSSYEPKIPGSTNLARAGESLAEELTPGIRPVEAILRKGGEEDHTSANPLATKPGTQTGLLPALGKEFSPVPFVVNRSKASGLRKEAPLRKEAVRKETVPLRKEAIRKEG